MPRYFFHVRRGQVTTVDNVGLELNGEAEAVAEAERRVRDLAAKGALSGRAPEPGTIIIEDQWQTVDEIHF